MMRDVRYLRERRAGGAWDRHPGNDSAAAYIARRFAAVGLSTGVRNRGFVQHFVARSVAAAHAGLPG
jgi:hypothetical protein